MDNPFETMVLVWFVKLKNVGPLKVPGAETVVASPAHEDCR